MKYFLLPFCLLLLLIACKTGQQPSSAGQGIEGQLWWLEGDFMPRIGGRPTGKRTPAQRSVVAYEAISLQAMKHPGPLFPSVPARKVAETESGPDGKFRLSLPPGIYSVFTREAEGLFANSFDGNGIVNPVSVKEGEFTNITLEINYAATY